MHQPTTSYVSRVIALPPGLALQVFDACRADRQFRSADPTRWVVPAGPSTSVVLHGDGRTTAFDDTRSWALRTVTGTLRSARVGPGLAVEVELDPWSATRAEVGIRFVGRRRPGERHVAAAGAVVDALAAELELRGLLALHPSHSTVADGRQQEAAASAWL